MNPYRRSIVLRAGVFLLGGIIACWIVLQGNLWARQPLVPALAHAPTYAQSSPPSREDGIEPIPLDPGIHPPAPAQGDRSETSPSTPESASSPIRLVGSEPPNEATDISIASRIELEFSGSLSEPLDTLDLTIEPAIPLQFNVADNRIVLEPSEELGYSTIYTVNIAPQAALPLAEPVQFSFKTEPEFTYNIDVKPLLDVSCVGCHGAFDTSRSSALLDTYSGVLSVVEPGNASSPLIDTRFTRPHARRRSGSQSLEQRYMRINGYPLDKLGSWSPAEIEIVTTWIVQDEAIESSAARQARLENRSNSAGS